MAIAVGAGIIYQSSNFAQLVLVLCLLCVCACVAVVISRICLTHNAENQARSDVTAMELRELTSILQRQRNTADLYDSVGHNLSLMILKAELTSKLIVRNSDIAKSQLSDLVDSARHTMRTVCDAAENARSVGLARALDLARESKAIHPLQINCASYLSPRHEALLSLIVQEARAAARQSITQHCSMIGGVRAGQFYLDISHDGVWGRHYYERINVIFQKLEELGGHITRIEDNPGTKVSILYRGPLL